ncbi:MAG: hypothetical protein CME05_15385 [Gemmatimonadaceae bacterium]|nr:hypothetical protein [Gemmatimonadaceae bacterium]
MCCATFRSSIDFMQSKQGMPRCSLIWVQGIVEFGTLGDGINQNTRLCVSLSEMGLPHKSLVSFKKHIKPRSLIIRYSERQMKSVTILVDIHLILPLRIMMIG